MRRVIVLLACGLALAGCAKNNVRWDRAGATAMDFDRDKASCQYEATLATPGSRMGPGIGGAVASGIADGLRMAELQTLCMQSKGWQRTVVEEG